MKPVVRLRATLQYCHALMVFWWAVCSEQVAIQISICCLSKWFFILEYCELTAMASSPSNITSVSKREKVISLWSSGYRNKEICSRLHLSHQTVSNILSKFLQNGTAAPGKPGWKERTVATPNVVEFVEYCKVFKPSTRTFEIQQGLLANAICTPANLPARSTISDIVRQGKREITFSLFETEVILLAIAVNSQYSNMKNRLLRQQIEIWIATCSEQTANQNTNIGWQYCKVARKRTTGFTGTE